MSEGGRQQGGKAGPFSIQLLVPVGSIHTCFAEVYKLAQEQSMRVCIHAQYMVASGY